MNRTQLIARIDALRAEAAALNNACLAADGTVRSMTDAEDAAYKAKMAEVKAAEAALARFDEAAPVAPPDPPSRGVRSDPPGKAPAAGTSRADMKPHSIARAIQCVILDKPIDGLEAEVDQEIKSRAARSGRILKGFGIPSSLNDPDVRSLMYPNVSAEAWERRDLTTITGAGSIYTVPRGFIELLRLSLMARRLGVEIMEDMQGNFAMTRQNGTNVVQWVGEGSSASPTNLTFDQVLFSPKLAIATTIYTRQFAMQSSISVDEKINNDLAAVMAREWDRVIFNGSGGVQPLGILQNPTIQALSVAAGLPIGPNGGPMTYGKAVDMEGTIATANAEVGKLAYLTNFNVRSQLKKTLEFPNSNNSMTVWSKGAAPDEGEVNTHRALAVAGLFNVVLNGVTTNYSPMPNNLTKGSSNNCSPVIYGNWGDYTVANWNTGVDVIVDIFSGKRSGAVEVTTEMAMDAHPMHEASFAIITDVTTP